MNRYNLILTTFISCLFSNFYAQDVADAILHSKTTTNGTARFNALGGAFGALGGDLTGMSENPAGSAVFSREQLGFSLSNQYKKNQTTYNGILSEDDANAFTLNQLGAVFVFDGKDGKKVTLGLNYDNTSTYKNSVFASGINPNNNSIANYYVNKANGFTANELSGSNPPTDSQQLQAYLGYQSYMISPASSNANETNYVSNMMARNDFYQEYTHTTFGNQGRMAFNIGGKLNDKLHLGINLNSHFIDYREEREIYEDNSRSNSQNTNGITSSSILNTLHSYGSGFSTQIGTIIAPGNGVRIGLTYQSPTWYRLFDETTTDISTNCAGCIGENGRPINNPQAKSPLNVYAPYTLQTADKSTASLAYVFGKSGFFSIDYSLRNYSLMRFRPINDRFFRPLNSQIKEYFDAVSEVRAGLEYRIEEISFRMGYAFEQSPYKVKYNYYMGDKNTLSAGFGYNFGNTKLDLAYSYSEHGYVQNFLNNGYDASVDVKNQNNNITLTLLFGL